MIVILWAGYLAKSIYKVIVNQQDFSPVRLCRKWLQKMIINEGFFCGFYVIFNGFILVFLRPGFSRLLQFESFHFILKNRFMIIVLKQQNGLNLIGQGGKIILFMLPWLIAAIFMHLYLPGISSLPPVMAFIRPLGYLLLVCGIMLWGTAVVQLLAGFSKGKLVTGGAYGIVRNPIYSSVTFFVLPAVAILTLTWVYFIPSVFLYTGVMLFIGKEEKQLEQIYGSEYNDYRARVGRMIPFSKSR